MSWNRRETERGYKNPILEKKTKRLKTVEGVLKNNCPMKYSKVIAMAIYNTGISRKTAVEYLAYFVDLEVIRIENGMVYLIDRNNDQSKNDLNSRSKDISED